MFLIPLFSLMVGKIGKKGIFMVIACSLSILTFIGMVFIPADNAYLPYVSIVMYCCFWSLQTASFWSSYSLSLPSQAFNVFLGMTVSGMNGLGAGLSVVFGVVNEKRTAKDYDISLFVLVGIGVICLILSIWIMMIDFRTGKIIHMPENDPRVKYLREKKSKNFELSKAVDRELDKRSKSQKSGISQK